jgi:pimeloyl-ACP methyl ester carboxylesterase
MEALRDEHVPGGAQQLQSARSAGQAGRAPVRNGRGTWILHVPGYVTGGLPNRMPGRRWAITVGAMSGPPASRAPVPRRRAAATTASDGSASAAPQAVLSTEPLPALGSLLTPWPGEQLPVRGGEVFVRHTPWIGPVRSGGAADGAPRERALYVHGLGGASTNWTDLAALLAVRFDGWALDLPGFGRSQPPPRGRYSVRGHVRAVVDLLEHISELPGEAAGQPVHLLGNSLGGLVSLLVASRRPDLVASLTLISPAMPVYRVPPAFSRALLLLLVPGIPALAARKIGAITPESNVRAMIRMCFGEPAKVPRERVEQAVQEMRQRAEQPWADRALTGSMRGLITSYLRVGAANAWRAARALRPPTLVVWGSRDRLVDPALAPRLADAVPDARLLVLDRVGHVAMLEAPEPTARAVLGLVDGLDRSTGRDGAVSAPT